MRKGSNWISMYQSTPSPSEPDGFDILSSSSKMMSLSKRSIDYNNSSVQVYEEDPQLDPYNEYDDYGDNAYDNESKDDEFYESDSIPLGHYL
ncbi:hypothetical protein ACFX15_020695 [Malus domestica]